MSWEDFVTKFKSGFVLTFEVQQLAHEFLALEHNIDLVAEFTTKFRERESNVFPQRG